MYLLEFAYSMNLFYPNSAPPHSYLRASFSLFPHIAVHQSQSKLFFRCRVNSIRLELNVYNDGKSVCGDKIQSVDKCDGIGCVDEYVEVIVVGSRKDAMLDFCSGSPFVSSALRFWNIIGRDSEPACLQQRFIRQDHTSPVVKDFLEHQSSCKACILVASAAYGSDHIMALDILSSIKSENELVVGIILKPFRFEGRRRQNEVKDLVNKLQKDADFCIVLDTDPLLENDLVTLDEALSTSNNAVLMVMNAISTIISERYVTFLNKKDNSTSELRLPEFRKICKSYNEARIGFGDGYNIRASFLRCTNDCPFLGVDVKVIDGVIICIFASSNITDCGDASTFLQTIRRIIGFSSDIIVSVVLEPNLEPDVILTTVIAFGYNTQKMAPRNGILSSLGQHFPFIFNIFQKKFGQPINSDDAYLSEKEKPHVSDAVNPLVIGDMFDAKSSNVFTETDVDSGESRPQVGNSDEKYDSSSLSYGNQESELSGTDINSSISDINAEGPQIFRRELLAKGSLGHSHSPQLLNYERQNNKENALIDSVNIYKLPVGVKHVEKYENTLLASNSKQGTKGRVDDHKKKQPLASLSVSLSGMMEAGDVSVVEIDKNSVSVFKKGNFISNSKKQGVLSVRAASMLESERVSEKKWNRVVEMKYRGGTYKGRAQGGLPEGKGRLLVGDGSLYDGMWRYGKRSGLGTFCFNNGDVFQGSWRDDAMHGKGWFYFHTGDRWFVNFWKGKANGESRFYSKLGDVSFGQFKDGWRHGHFLRINVDGTRIREVWDEGVLVNEESLDEIAQDG